jgi:anti-sigma factor RsiW
MSQYLDGELTPRRRAALKRHIDTCACCSTLAERLRTVSALAKGEQAPAPKRVQALAARRVRALLKSQR